jgi:competence protein ComEA
MNGFIKSYTPILKGLRKYTVEIILVLLALTITVASLFIFIKNNQSGDGENFIDEASLSPIVKQQTIFIDISGSIKKPNLYQVNSGTRLKEIIEKAGGLSEDADIVFFNRNFNLARILIDQEKIYIPSVTEINNGIFIQNQQTLDNFIQKTDNISVTPSNNANQLINLNSATIEELDQLPGIGLVTANKIVTSRPYSVIEELLTKKVINKSVFEKIKSLVTI